jgi:RNA polymerase sigma-70 factor (ECF subfamily)
MRCSLRARVVITMFGRQSKQAALQQSFESEAVPHLDALFATALRLTKSEEDANDLVQETMLKAYRYFDKYQEGTNCKAWLFKIMTNTFINRYRKQQKRREFLVDDDFRPLQDRAEAPAENPFVGDYVQEEQLYYRLFGDEVKQALEEIPVDFRMVVLLADLQDFAYKEIAEIMECPIGTVMSRLYRGRRMLQSRLVEYARAQGVEIPAELEEAMGAKPKPAVDDAEQITDLSAYRRKRSAS